MEACIAHLPLFLDQPFNAVGRFFCVLPAFSRTNMTLPDQSQNHRQMDNRNRIPAQFRHKCAVFAKNAYMSEKQVPPAGVVGIKTRRKVYWATVGNRRPNVVSLVIDNKSSFLARLRPLICHTYATQIWSTSSVEF